MKYAVTSGSDTLELLAIEETDSQIVSLTGRVTSTVTDKIVFVAFYQSTGQMVNILTPSLDGTGTFNVESPVSDAEHLRIFFLDAGSFYLPLTPFLEYPLS